MEPKITISVVTFNGLSLTRNFLDSLYSTTKIPFDLIIVDNNSTDGTVEYLKEFDREKNVKIILNEDNKGFGPAHNIAFSFCTTKYFAPVNNDVLFPEMFIDKALNTIISNPDYKQLGTSKVKDVSEMNTLNSKDFSPSIRNVTSPQDYVGGSFFIIESEIVRSIGELFDERFEIGFCEDVDLSWRLGLAGFKLGVISNLYFTHFENSSFDSNEGLIPTKRSLYIKNTLRFIDKWDSLIKEDLKKQLFEGASIEDLVIIRTPIRSRNIYKNSDQKKFEEDLMICLDQPNIKFIDVLKKYIPENYY
jgi:GT2 family glycosyltransferase